jgi:putative serine protease PepD
VTSADGLILAVRSYSVGDEVDVVFVRDGKEQTVKVTLGSDEALQAEQEEQRKKQEEEYQQQLEEYQNYLNQQQDGRGQGQSWPWDSYGWPWEMWDWNGDSLGNPGSYSRR